MNIRLYFSRCKGRTIYLICQINVRKSAFYCTNVHVLCNLGLLIGPSLSSQGVVSSQEFKLFRRIFQTLAIKARVI